MKNANFGDVMSRLGGFRRFALGRGFSLVWLGVALLWPNVVQGAGEEEYVECCREGQSVTFDTVVDVAYGANGSFRYLSNVTGIVLFSNAVFGDPAPGVAKKGYYRPAAGGSLGKRISWDQGAEDVSFKQVTQRVGGGVLTLTLSSGNADPYIRWNKLGLQAASFNHLRIRLRNDTSGSAWKVFFKPSGGVERGNSIDFQASGDGVWKTFVLRLDADPDWKGVIDSIRLDPQGSVSGTVKIDYMELISTPGSSPVAAKGALPAGMPDTFALGLFSDHGDRWMRDSGVAWDLRYRYFVKGWIDNWGWTPERGLWALDYFKECQAQGFLPSVQYYQLLNDGGNDESKVYDTLKSASKMKSYFQDFKVLMQRAKEFDKPVLILLEADMFGFLGLQTNFNPQAYAAIADSGMPELAGLPNTVAGWGLAFLQIRKSVGASKAILGMHISAWGSGKDIAYYSLSDPLQPEVDRVFDFLGPLGLSPNATGETFDLLVGDPCDRDADYYRIKLGEDRWWDQSDAAAIASKSFNRYAAWLRLWNEKAQKRWVLWQIPLGNSNHKNVPNAGGAREGYKDNRVQYFLSDGDPSHARKFADAGVVALLFGAGQSDQATYQNDYGADGKLYLQAQAAAFYAKGSFKLDK